MTHPTSSLSLTLAVLALLGATGCGASLSNGALRRGGASRNRPASYTSLRGTFEPSLVRPVGVVATPSSARAASGPQTCAPSLLPPPHWPALAPLPERTYGVVFR